MFDRWILLCELGDVLLAHFAVKGFNRKKRGKRKYHQD
jgi:hypothetical protein